MKTNLSPDAERIIGLIMTEKFDVKCPGNNDRCSICQWAKAANQRDLPGYIDLVLIALERSLKND